MNKQDWTPEELELKEALNKLYETDTRVPPKPLDLSFMNESAENTSVKRRRRLAYIAAAVLLVFASSFATAVFISNDYASAVQDKIQRKVFEMKHGVVVATDEEFAEEGETVWEITDFETAKKAKELVPELPIPGYVPEGYEFERLVLHLYPNRYIANYTYNYDIHMMIITCQALTNSDDNLATLNVTDTIHLNDRTIYISKDPINITTTCFITLQDSFVSITPTDGQINTDALLKTCTEIK